MDTIRRGILGPAKISIYHQSIIIIICNLASHITSQTSQSVSIEVLHSTTAPQHKTEPNLKGKWFLTAVRRNGSFPTSLQRSQCLVLHLIFYIQLGFSWCHFFCPKTSFIQRIFTYYSTSTCRIF